MDAMRLCFFADGLGVDGGGRVLAVARMNRRIAHCLQRLKQRYGLEVGPWLIERHERMIRTGAAIKIGMCRRERGQTDQAIWRIEDAAYGVFWVTAWVSNGNISTYLREAHAKSMRVGSSAARYVDLGAI